LRAEVDFDIKNRKIIDIQRLFHMMEKRNLSAAYKFYCAKNLDNAHSAEADTLATLEILEAQVARYADSPVTDNMEHAMPIARLPIIWGTKSGVLPMICRYCTI